MILTAQNIGKTYPNGKKALQNISFTAASPSLIGLVGPNGAGKTTLMKLLVAGLLPTEGTLLCNDIPLGKQEGALKAKLGYLPQFFGLYDELTVWQFLDYMAALKGTPNSRTAIAQVLEQTNLSPLQKARIAHLSGGQRQRVGIAQALLGTPELLIFDEPTVGLDPEERIKFRNLFSQAAKDKVVFLSTHIIEDVQSICDRILVIEGGRLLFDGSPEALIRRAERHVGTQLDMGERALPPDCRITAQVSTARGVAYRLVGDHLPAGAASVEPTLEDAYMYLISREGVIL